MKDKILSEYSVESNGETIIVKTIQTEKGITVDITGRTMDVLVNKEEVYSKFDKIEYKDIPSHIRGFVEKYLCNYGGGIRKEVGKVFMYIQLDGRDYNMEIPTNRAKCKDIFISDWLESYDKIQTHHIEIPNAKENYEKLLFDINNVGYKFEFACEGNQYDNVYRLVIPIRKFDENKVNQCIKLWAKYNEYLDEYIRML